MEVFPITANDPDRDTKLEPGWYWWYCQPGCLPDSQAFGPYETRSEAVADIKEEHEEFVATGGGNPEDYELDIVG